ncbi:MAG: hypothetical protein PHW04_12120 [Candidatus Wallbacteria bacterium]|nr:hypothetical protein [Candidatus Wallbacteria bacterium]
MLSRLVICFVLAVCLIAASGQAREAVLPETVKILPVFFVPKDEPAPTDEQADRLMRHLIWSQKRYCEMLRNQDTFAIAERKPLVYRAMRKLSFYRERPEGLVALAVSELLAELNFTRYNCPYILLVVVMNQTEDFPVGCGCPLNGGLNRGGGVLVLSSFSLDRAPNFQSTLQHELGHSFGLPHVDEYGYDMNSNNSIMSYNLKHHTNQFAASLTPGELIPEDVRALALCRRIFPRLSFDRKTDLPKDYKLAERIVPIWPMKIPGQPDGWWTISTDSGEEYESKVSNLQIGLICPNRKDGTVTYDSSAMWHSAKTGTGWVSLQISFPKGVDLSRIVIHSQHSGEYHIAKAALLAVKKAAGFSRIIETDLDSADAVIVFPPTGGRVWKLDLRAGESGYVVLRGLQFFSGAEELFPPMLPYQQ